MYAYIQLPTEARGIEVPAAGVRSACEPPGMGAGNLTQVLCKSSVCPLSPMIRLSSPASPTFCPQLQAPWSQVSAFGVVSSMLYPALKH